MFLSNRSSRNSGELLAKNPEGFGRCFINGPRAHTAEELAICRDHRRDIAVFAINPALAIQLRLTAHQIVVAEPLPDGMRRPVSTGCDTLPIIDVLEAQEKGDRL